MSATTVEKHAEVHEHPPFQQHHFINTDQQFDASKMGIWLFLVTEVLLFSGMFVAYAVYRSLHPEAFVEAFSTLNWIWGCVNTIFLLTSSWTMVMAIQAIQKDDQKKMIWYLFLTISLAFLFMCVKFIEYSGKFEHGIFFGMWEPHGDHYGHLAEVPYARIFMNIYFVITGIHGLHVLIGMGILSWVIWQGFKGRFNSKFYTHVEVAGLYWHLVDIIWIFLFPLLYLV